MVKPAFFYIWLSFGKPKNAKTKNGEIEDNFLLHYAWHVVKLM